MRVFVLSVGLCASLASANINFPKPYAHQLCDPAALWSGCARGMHCGIDSGLCEFADHENLYPSSFTSADDAGDLKERATYSTDGTCGPNNGNTLCDPNSSAYTGSCCSQYGYCGNTAAYCGTGCVSGCGNTAPGAPVASVAPTAPSGTAPRSDGRCGSDFGGATCDASGPYGGCCSSYGYGPLIVFSPKVAFLHKLRLNIMFKPCSGIVTLSFLLAMYCGNTPAHCLVANGCQSGCTGAAQSSVAVDPVSSANPTATQVKAPSTSTTGEPVIGSPTVGTGAAATSGVVTADGTCGSTNNGMICVCGNTTAHCGTGCQSGPCIGGVQVQAPGPSPAPANPNPGSMNVVGQSGVPAMHAGLMPNGRVIFLDKLENYTQIKLADGYYAYSSEYDPETNTAVGLSYMTNAFCSGGSFLPDGRWLSLGGNAPLDFIDPTIGDGFNAIRYLDRSSTDASLNGQSWSEPGNKLASDRWYASAQTMPDGTIFVASGSLNGLDPTVLANNNPTYEILNNQGVSDGVNVPMAILEKNQPYYMYPFMHLLSDGTLFVFVAKSAENFNVDTNTTVRSFPDLPGDYRTYPNTGGSVLLPLSSANNWAPDVVVCGGGAYQDITSPTDPSCGRIQPLAANAAWEMDSMPQGRGMVEGILLPDGTVIFINGANLGAEGFGLAADPTYTALIYDPTKPLGQRFTTGATSPIARLYHSVALLLLDGTLMIAGSNPVQMPILTPDAGDPYVTEFRVEIYTPPYLSGDNANKRPTNVELSSTNLTPNGQTFTVSFNVPAGAQGAQVSLYHGGFVTHAVHMSHRMAFLDTAGWQAGSTSQTLTVTMPPNNNVAPPGPYVVYVVVDGVPAIGQFVSLN
ncbi:MAG: hypothetical protein M1827_007434 [Pycnora praestabilis]|nr:MAG: hypothetical protein M1827_007434 [Pycnora praestabilis]